MIRSTKYHNSKNDYLLMNFVNKKKTSYSKTLNICYFKEKVLTYKIKPFFNLQYNLKHCIQSLV